MVHSETKQGSLQIGVFADNLKLPLMDGVRKAAELGVASFQIFTTAGEASPEQMSKTDRENFRGFYQDLGLILSATCADFGHGFVDPEKNVNLIPKTKEMIDMAIDLGTDIITTHIGVVPEDENEIWDTLATALNEIGAYAEERGVCLATETGPESGPVLRDLITSLDTTAIRVNFDPANLTMNGFNVDEALDALLPFVVHTHAKDGINDPGKFIEVPLGEGDVVWDNYIARMKKAGYIGAFTIERELGDDPIGDIQKAINFLRQY